MSDHGTLPLDLLTDTLSRVPIKSLFRFKCVSLSWKTLISSPHFAQTKNAQNPNPNPNIILASVSHSLHSVEFSDANPTAKMVEFPSGEWAQVFCSSNALLLVSDKNNNNLFLLNPSSRECKKLPPLPVVLNPAHRGFHLSLYGVGYDSSRDDYKVLMLCKNVTVTEFGFVGKETPDPMASRVNSFPYFQIMKANSLA